MIHVAICDDNLDQVRQIENMIKEFQETYGTQFQIEMYCDGNDLKKSVEKGKKYELIYLDIEMDKMNGIEAAKYIRRVDTTVLLIYISAHNNYLEELFSVEPFRFIPKPIEKRKFDKFLSLAIKRIKSNNGIYCFRFNKDIIAISLKEVEYFESHGSMVNVHLQNNSYRFYKKLDEVQKEVIRNYRIPFIRVHKSYLVNFLQITRVGYSELETKGGNILRISETYKRDVRANYNKLLLEGQI